MGNFAADHAYTDAPGPECSDSGVSPLARPVPLGCCPTASPVSRVKASYPTHVTYIFPTVATPSPTLPAATNTAAAHLVLINPPALAGRTNERTFSGGIGVSRALKPFEREEPTILPIDFLYLAAVAEKAGCRVTLVDLLIDRCSGSEATRVCLERIGPARGAATWVGVRLSMPSLAQDLAFADRLKAQLPDARVFVFGAAIMATIDHWIGRTRVDYVCFGEPEAFFDQCTDCGASRDGTWRRRPVGLRPARPAGISTTRRRTPRETPAGSR